MALIRSLSRQTIRVGSYCPQILSTSASKNTYDFHRSISGINDNLKREFKNARPSTRSYTRCARNFHRTTTNRIDGGIEDIDQEEIPERDAEELLEDADYKAMVEEQYILPADGHSLMLIQPDMKIPYRKNHLTTADMQLEEACALVDSLPRWTVVEKAIYSLKHINKYTVYQKGNFEEITQRIRKNKSITAVFISLDMLSGLQLANLQDAFKVPVYDRYTIVLQIFKIRAQTKEAKLQVALAELPYFKSRLHGLHKGTLDQQRGTFGAVRGMGETSLEIKHRLVNRREVQLKKALDKLKDQREIVKKERRRREIPTVAVVGYTNSGKTSLIKAVTGDKDIMPLNKLFATLDVTVHAGSLPNRTKVLYVDTVGFISDIPTELIASFRATLHDMLTADVIVHVTDMSHPDQIAQRQNVLDTLGRLKIPNTLKENIIEVGNKVDKLPRDIPYPEGCLPISATTGIGLDVLREQIQDVIIETTGRVKKKLKVRQGGPLLSWLHKQATVQAMDVNPDDPEYLIVTAIFTEAQWGRFKSQFVPRNDRKKQKSQNIDR